MRGRHKEFTEAAERCLVDIHNKAFHHNGDFLLTRHVLNARRSPNKYGISISNPNRQSPNKIDFAVCQIALGAGIAKSEYDKKQADKKLEAIVQEADERAACVADVLADFLLATNERTTYTEELANADVEQSKAFAALVTASLRPVPPDEDEARAIVEEYDRALSTYLEVAEKAANKRENNPYPTAAEIEACR